jgi:site-specific recombinase XerD
VNDFAATLQTYFTSHATSQRGLSPNTIASYRDTWRLFIRHLADEGVSPDKAGFADLRPDTVAGFLEMLQTTRGNSDTTRNARLAAIKAVARYALPNHPDRSHDLTQILALPTKRATKTDPVFLTPEETELLLAAPDTTTWTGRRDQAMLALAAQTGLRISELTTLATSDLHLARPARVHATGKGRKHRDTPLTGPTITLMRAYLAERATRPGHALFPGPRGNPLSRDAVERRLTKHLAAAATKNPALARKNISMHALRHTAAMRLLEAGVDIAVIALWLGHEHTTTTDRYLHAHLGLKQAALDRTRPPDVTPGVYTPTPDVLAWLDRL